MRVFVGALILLVTLTACDQVTVAWRRDDFIRLGTLYTLRCRQEAIVGLERRQVFNPNRRDDLAYVRSQITREGDDIVSHYEGRPSRFLTTTEIESISELAASRGRVIGQDVLLSPSTNIMVNTERLLQACDDSLRNDIRRVLDAIYGGDVSPKMMDDMAAAASQQPTS